MLKEYQLSNFKAFSRPETLPIKPITLIFGPNSSGKSSIFQSLLLSKQTLEDRENPLLPLLVKGDFVDLGSYRDLIYRHETDRSFSFKVTLQIPKGSADVRYPGFRWALLEKYWALQCAIETFQEVGMSVSFSCSKDKPLILVSRIDVFLGNQSSPIITYKYDVNSLKKWKRGRSVAELILTHVDKMHKYWVSHYRTFKGLLEDKKIAEVYRSIYDWNQLTMATKALDELKKDECIKVDTDLELEQAKIALHDAEYIKFNVIFNNFIEEFDKNINPKELKLATKEYEKGLKGDRITLQNFLPCQLNGVDAAKIWAENDNDLLYEEQDFEDDLSLLTLAVADAFRSILAKMLYIGPLRSYPDRYFMFGGISTSYVGKFGKFVPDILVNDIELLSKVNEQFDRFDLGYELKLSSLSDQTTAVHDLFALRFFDKSTGIHVGTTDVGFGFGQVLPVIVQCLLSKQNMILIEQPELHLHPRLQAELGDLFIDSALGESRNTLIIETHSEHLILRLLRRIRETSEGRLENGQIAITPDDLAVVYAKPTPEGTKLIHLRVTEDGDFADPWPDGFFPERARELL